MFQNTKPGTGTTSAAFIAATLTLSACSTGPAPVSLANPAAEFCVASNGNYETRSSEAGTYGVCLFQDGTESDAWTYYRSQNPS